jgi:hypothetical protein
MTESGQPSQPHTPEQELQAATARVVALRQEIARLIAHEQELQTQQAQLQSLLPRYELQIQRAREAGNEEQAGQIEEQRQQVPAKIASLDQQMAEVGTQRKALAQQQTQLLSQIERLSASLGKRSAEQARKALATLPGGATQPPPPPTSRRPSRRFIILCSLAALAIILILAQFQVPGAIIHLFSRATPTHVSGTVTPDPNAPFYHSAGTAPATSDCLNTYSYACYSPEQMQQAFQFTPLYKRGITGSGQTIVILGAGYTTFLQGDLHQFDLAWGLPDPTLTILQPHGPPALYTCPRNFDRLQLENTLDVEWAHAMAPGANLVLIVGDNRIGSPQENCVHGSIVKDVSYALSQHLGQIISISYGGSELGTSDESADELARQQQSERQADAVFQQAAQEGVTVVASAGDLGATNFNDLVNLDSLWDRPNVSWPASDPYVLAVGGTTVGIDQASGKYFDEVAWNRTGFGATGGGQSILFSEPDYQKLVPDQTLFQGQRGIPDVAFPADNFIVYASVASSLFSKPNPRWTHWDVIGGTSASAPCWAGLIALADQMLGKPVGLLQPALYHLQGKEMHDITQGNNTFNTVQGYQALPGYDLVTGWGTPIADQLLSALMSQSAHLQAEV